MQVVILAGGLGTRLRTVAGDRPKPLVEVGGKPFLQWQVEYLRSQGLRDFVFCVGYRHEQIRQHFGTGAWLDVRIRYAVEEQLLGTAGALGNARPFITGPFLALNGDTFCNLDVRGLLDFHRGLAESDPLCLGTIALTFVPDARAYGSVELSSRAHVSAFREKSPELSGPGWISAGIYVLQPAVLDAIPRSQPVSLEKETFPSLLRAGSHLAGYRTRSFFVDIGTPAGLRVFERYVEDRMSPREPDAPSSPAPRTLLAP